MTTTGALGAALVVAGSALAARSAMLLGGRGRPRRGPRPAFVVAGPYQRLRNPLVAGVLVAAAGVALAGRSPSVAVGTLIAAAASHAWIVYVEEPRLTARFGSAYEAYLRCVPRWLPRSTSRANR
jgi:protein-S-isoprenylcysteine O-methyltransferase Ste14